jgi:hypothetical protein
MIFKTCRHDKKSEMTKKEEMIKKINFLFRFAPLNDIIFETSDFDLVLIGLDNNSVFSNMKLLIIILMKFEAFSPHTFSSYQNFWL